MRPRIFSSWVGTLALVVLGVFAFPSQADAWIYDDRCADKSSTEFDLKAPNALLMLDRSGSMRSGAGNGLSRWTAAVQAINEVTNEFHRSGTCTDQDRSGCDKVRFGLGLFYSGRRTYRCRQRYRDYYTIRTRQRYRYRVSIPYTARVPQTYRVRVPQSYYVRVLEAYNVRVRRTSRTRVRVPYWTTRRVAYTYSVRAPYTYYVNVRKRTPYMHRYRVRRCYLRRSWWRGWYYSCSYRWEYAVRYSYRWVRERRTGYRWETRTGYRTERVRAYRWEWQTRRYWVTETRYRWTWQRRTRWGWDTRTRWVNETRYRSEWRWGYRWVSERRWRWAYRWTTCSSYGNQAEIPDPVGEDNRNPIMSTLNSNSPGGGTPTGDAAKAMYQSSDLKDTERTNVGILITDGYPSGGTQASDAAKYLCRMRTRTNTPAASYVIGFSSGTDTDYNNLMAAAGGTGRCCNARDRNCPASREIDPCDRSDNALASLVTDIRRGGTGGLWCEGSYQANNPEQFKQALISITNDIACTFRLDLPQTYTSGKAYSDSDATRVKMYHNYYGWIDVPHKDSGQLDNELRAAGASSSTARQYANEGWAFADQARTEVKLTPRLCGEIAAGRGDEVTTQVACACPDVGSSCSVDGSSSVCSQGSYVCDIPPGEQFCQASYGSNAVIGTPCTVPNEVGRCAIGQLVCSNGGEVCESLHRPMPEICNGIDDDCDGQVDDLDDANTQFGAINFTPEHETLSCYAKNVCSCPNGPEQVSGLGSTAQSEYDDYLASSDGSCVCGESFSE